MNYPNRIVKKGEADSGIVSAIQKKLNEKGCGPIAVDGDYGAQTISAVKLFQTRHTDNAGTPLFSDGQIGALTWSALFGTSTVANNSFDVTSTPLANAALAIAISQINVCESPLYSNRGPQVDQYLKAVGLNPQTGSYSWCAAFVYWSYNQAAQQLGTVNPLIKTAGVLDHWRRAKCTKITTQMAANDPSYIKPGSIFVIDHGGGLGHTGIVESVSGGNLTTIEGNTNNDLSRNGYGVFRLNRRKIININKGFLVYDK